MYDPTEMLFSSGMVNFNTMKRTKNMLGYVCRFVHASEMLIHLDDIEISIRKHYELEF